MHLSLLFKLVKFKAWITPIALVKLALLNPIVTRVAVATKLISRRLQSNQSPNCHFCLGGLTHFVGAVDRRVEIKFSVSCSFIAASRVSCSAEMTFNTVV